MGGGGVGGAGARPYFQRRRYDAGGVDTTVPVVSIQQVWHGVASYTIADSDTTPPTVSCTILDSTKHIVGSVTGCTVAGPAQYSGLAHGVYVFIVSATDPAGHTASDSRSFKP